MFATPKALHRLPAGVTSDRHAGLLQPLERERSAFFARPRTQVVQDWDELARLEPEWNELLLESRADTIFLSWEWMRAWLEASGSRRRALSIVVRDARGRLAGVAPFYLEPYCLLGIVPYRVLRIAGDHPTGGEYGDWLLRPDMEFTAAEAIAKTLAAHEGWDALWMPQVSGWSGARESIEAACSAAGLHCRARPASFGHFTLPDSFETYERNLSDNRRKQIRTQRRKVLRDGVSITRCGTQDELPRYLQALFDLHGRRRRTLGDPGTFVARPEEAEFYRRFAPQALANGWLWLSALEEGGVIRAIQLGYQYRGAYHQLQEGFDPDFTPGAGNVLRHEVIRQCIASGLGDYDFLGGYTEHKRRWMAEERQGYDLWIGRAGILNSALFSAPLWPTGRFLHPAD